MDGEKDSGFILTADLTKISKGLDMSKKEEARVIPRVFAQDR